MRVALLVLFIGAISAAPSTYKQRIVGGSVTTINNYPQMAVLLLTWDLQFFYQGCGGSILNQRNILTAAHCFDDFPSTLSWRIRVGSSFAHSGGTVHNVAQIIIHPDYDMPTFNSDVAIMRTSSFINYIENAVQPGVIAGPNYRLGDDEIVWAAGWGETEYGMGSEQLRHVQIWTINQNVCRSIYSIITDNMLCTGWLNVGGRDQCRGDSGGPLYHNGIIVGICSFGSVLCGSPSYPGVNARVSRFTPWITANAA